MGRPTAVTVEQVVEVAEALYARGNKNPSAKNVRDELESRAAPGAAIGSPNTIQQHLDQWKRLQRPQEGPSVAATLPPQLADDIARALNVAAERARKDAEANIAVLQEEKATLVAEGLRLEALNSDIAAELTARTTERDAMQGQLADRTAEVERLREALRLAEEQIVTLTGQAHEATASAQAAEGRVDEIRSSTAKQLQQMQTELDLYSTRASQATAAAVAADQRAVAAEARLEGAQEAAQTAKAQLADMQTQVSRLQDAATRAVGAEATAASLREQVAVLTSTLNTVAHLLPPGLPGTGSGTAPKA